MIGMIDPGGTIKAVFANGILDRLQDEHIILDYFIGVSAGAANGCSYVSGQRGRNLDFYLKYNLSSKSIGLLAWLKTRGSLIDLDYIYGTLSASNGKSPVDFNALSASSTQFKIVATDYQTAEPVYFDKSDMRQDDYRVLCASSCNPVICKPYHYQGKYYCDGYVSDPIPVEKAISDGCEKIIVCLPLPKNHMRSSKSFEAQAKRIKNNEAIAEKIARGSEIYNRKLQICLDLEKAGKALILYPQKVNLGAFEKDKKKIYALYQEGYDAGVKVKKFLEN